MHVNNSLPAYIFFVLLALLTGCTGSSSYSQDASTISTTYLGKKQVVSGTVYGYAPRTLVNVSAKFGTSPDYLSLTSGQFAYTNYVAKKPNTGEEFSATFSDGSRLYSVWNGTESSAADITFAEHRSFSNTTYSLSVNPQEPSATVNINPVTNLAYWLWRNDSRHPYSDYRNNVFTFLMEQFPAYQLPPQNPVSDNLSQQLLHLLNDISISVNDSFSGFSLTNNVTGQPICSGSFSTFPICE